MSNPAKRAPPPLRVRCFAISNFRTFRERTIVPFRDDVTVFHGDTGSGKSTALAALDIFFRALSILLPPNRGGIDLLWPQVVGSFGRQEVLISERDRPFPAEPTVLAATFADNPAAWIEVRFEPLGQQIRVLLAWAPVQAGEPVVLVQRLYPFGATSRPLAILDARRRPRWKGETASASLLAPSLAAELYAQRTSKLAVDRERWRAFADSLTTFPTLRGATVSIEAGSQPGPSYELVVEHPGRVVLGLDELSSGEQELVSLTAALLLSKAGIVALQEPEMGLDVQTQAMVRAMCMRQLEAGFVDQIIFESHAVTFDGPEVVRFSRNQNGATRVESVAPAANDELARLARESGAEQAFVSPAGYTLLPENMRKETGAGDRGAQVWFLRGPERWEAWPESQLQDLLSEKKT